MPAASVSNSAPDPTAIRACSPLQGVCDKNIQPIVNATARAEPAIMKYARPNLLKNCTRESASSVRALIIETIGNVKYPPSQIAAEMIKTMARTTLTALGIARGVFLLMYWRALGTARSLRV